MLGHSTHHSHRETHILTLDRVILVEGLAIDIFSLRAMDRPGHTLVGPDDHVSFCDGELEIGDRGTLSEQLPCRRTQYYAHDAINEFKDDSY